MLGHYQKKRDKNAPPITLLSVGFKNNFLIDKNLKNLADFNSLGNVTIWKTGMSIIAKEKPAVVYVNMKFFSLGYMLPTYFKEIDTKFIGVCKDLEQVAEAYKNNFLFAFEWDSWDEFFEISLESIKQYHSRSIRKSDFENKFFGQFSFHSRLIAPTKSGFSVLKIREIDFLESELHNTLIYYCGKRARVFLSLNRFEEMLFKFNFRRVHKSFLVNMNNVSEYRRSGKEILIVGNHEVMVSHRKRPEINQFLKSENCLIRKYNLPPF
ncbi:MAG: hypothetical protein ACJATA_001879 [Sphingobacteriales bacterium]|jgi:hypothetical protein